MEPKEVINKTKGALTKKLGPLPAWGWGVVTAGAIWVYRGWRNNLSAQEPSTTLPDAGAIVPSLSGGVGPGPTPGYGAPDGDPSPLYYSDRNRTIEGDPGTVAAIIDKLIADQRADTTVGGGGSGTPNDTDQPGSQWNGSFDSNGQPISRQDGPQQTGGNY